MSKDIRISKGLDIKLKGEAEKVVKDAKFSSVFAVSPSDFHGTTPKLAVKQGDQVKIGSPLFYNKAEPEIQFVSPVSGEVAEVVRGAKRKILEIRILPDANQTAVDFGSKEVNALSREEIVSFLCKGGCWSMIKRRPYDVTAKLNDLPKAIFISAYGSAPLAPDYDYLLKDKKTQFQLGVNVLSKLTTGKVHLTIANNTTENSPFGKVENAEKHKAYGPHPVGTASVQIAKIDPINKGEVVWVVDPADVATIGELFETGKYNPAKMVAVTGSQVENPIYVNTIRGAQIKDILALVNINGENNRIINGNVLTGSKVTPDGFLSQQANQLTIIPEGDDYDFMGWQLPRPNKFSFYRIDALNWLVKTLNGKKKYVANTNTNGEHRAYVLTGNFEKVFPLDIFPLQLLKSCMIGDIDGMEQLGIYEVAPEDFALTEFIDVSKHNHQDLIRKSLDLMIEEVG